MNGTDDDLRDFPVWMWRYLDPARVAKADAQGAATPITTRIGALLAAAMLKDSVGRIDDAPRPFELEELAGFVALAAAATGDQVLSFELGVIADRLAARSNDS